MSDLQITDLKPQFGAPGHNVQIQVKDPKPELNPKFDVGFSGNAIHEIIYNENFLAFQVPNLPSFIQDFSAPFNVVYSYPDGTFYSGESPLFTYIGSATEEEKIKITNIEPRQFVISNQTQIVVLIGENLDKIERINLKGPFFIDGIKVISKSEKMLAFRIIPSGIKDKFHYKPFRLRLKGASFNIMDTDSYLLIEKT